MNHSKRPLRSLFRFGAAVLSSISLAAVAQTPPTRLAGPISNESRAVLAGSHQPRATAANDLGVLPASTAINGITLVFNQTPAQAAALQALLTAQRNPASPQYQQWLTPEQYGTQFGVSDADLSTVESWLSSQGFTGMTVSRNRDRITFSGTAAQVNTAFGTEMHQYRATTTAPNGSTTASARPDYAPSTDLMLPAALAPVVLSVQHLSTFRPRPNLRVSTVKPDYTSSLTQAHHLTPPDLATMYDVSPTYNSGFNGAGQTIAIAGQTYIQTSDVAHFQSAANLPANLPSLFLVPNSGGSALYPGGDEAESDLDVEYALGMARGANVILVYVGSSENFGVFDALTYAVTDDIAPIISVSYGSCEIDTSTTELNTYTNVTNEAQSQGQTIISSAGDSGSTTCSGDTDLTLVQQETPSVDFIADLPNVTGVGGLQMQAGTFTTGNTQYFAAATGSDNISSLLSYVPETVWNEDTANGLSSGGGGTSTLVPRPSWQTGVPGIPAGAFRLVPDISLQASTNDPGFLICTSDSSVWQTGQTSSCTNGFRDANSSQGLLTLIGGTSVSAPSFAGMLAVLNQAKHITRQGNVNPTLYGLAGNATTYASAFHDITTGTNACSLLDTGLCSAAGAAEYNAGVGYDEASGLGSIDFAHLVAAWPNSTGSTLAASTTTLTAATATPAAGATDAITINVTSTTAGTPTGSVAVSVDGSTPTTVALSAGVANFTFPATTARGSHVVTATYSGDGTFAPSLGTLTLTLAGTSIPSGSFSFTATNVTVPANSTGNSTVNLTASGGYNGTVNFSITSTLPANTCYSVTPINTAVVPVPQYTLTIGNGAAICATGALRKGAGSSLLSSRSPSQTPWGPGHKRSERTGTILAGLFALGFAARRRRSRLPALMAMALLTLALSFGLSGCGGNSATPVAPASGTTATGTYTVTLVGTDSITSSITSSTTFTLTL